MWRCAGANIGRGLIYSPWLSQRAVFPTTNPIEHMPNDQNQHDVCEEFSSVTSQTNPTTHPGGTGPQILQEDFELQLRELEDECGLFHPTTTPMNWDGNQDRQEYVEAYGESNDYRRDTAAFLEKAVARLNSTLDAGINYFSKKNRSVPQGGVKGRWLEF